MDPTENARRLLVDVINCAPGSRQALEAQYGQVWDTDELKRDFRVLSFLAPFVLVERVSDGKRGTMMFQHSERYYWGFSEEG